MSEAEPTVEQVWERSIAIFGSELKCWPRGIGPGNFVRLAVRNHHVDPPGVPELCRIDYLATVAPILAFLVTSDDDYDWNQWPPCTPTQFATAMETSLPPDQFARFVEVMRLRPDDVPKPGDPIH